MKENVVIVNCKVPSEAYQILSMLRQNHANESFTITQSAVVKKDAGHLSLEDGFISGDAIEGRGWTGGLIGSLVGLLAGPLGVLLGGSVGSMIGDSMDMEELEGKSALLERAGECLVDGETALLLMAQEEDETALGAMLKDFQTSITRMDAKEIAAEIEAAEKQTIKADKIIRNAKIFTADKDKPQATALAVKDGKFVYVGDDAGLSAYEGEVTDLGGKFIMPSIIDSHVHVTTGVGFEYADLGLRFECNGKKEALDFMEKFIKDNPGQKRYRFYLERKYLKGEELTKDDLDAICPDAELVIVEGEVHSNWVNSKVLELHGITDETPDPVPGLAYFVRKDGHLTGNSFESASWPFIFDSLRDITDEQIGAAVTRWIEYCKKEGVSCVFDAGFPMHNWLHEKIYAYLRKLDMEGKLPVYIDGCYVLTIPAKKKEALEELKRFNREFDTGHLKVHTLKIFMDGTLKIETAAQVTPYADTGEKGYTTFEAPELAEIIVELNKMGFDLHTHCVGERASRVVLDAVELARKTLGDDYRVKVTCAHLEIQDDADLNRFAKLGVIANFTPWWHAGSDAPKVLLGEERAKKMYRCKTLWDSGTLVSWSSDNVAYGDFATWSPYLGMEIGMTRWSSKKTNVPDYMSRPEEFPPVSEKMSIEEMILGYTIHGAKQLGIEAHKGSITAGKDADFLVFDNDLLTAEHEGFSYNKPRDVYFGGKKMN